jgi:DNA-binding response OmpR family regulator
VSAASASVLIVDDSALNRLLVAATLRRDGYRILEAPDGDSGLEMIAHEKPDLVIVDFMMPGMDGAEMMSLLRKRGGSSMPRILLMTAMDEAESAAKARELGADAHLIKPFAPAALRARVEELMTDSSANPEADANS